MKVFRQLAREFIIPFVLSLSWVAFNVLGSSEDWDIRRTINVFGPTFFLSSWMIGQIYRVKKQLNIEENFASIQDRMLALMDQVSEQAEEISNHMTGGDGFVYLLPQLYERSRKKGVTFLLMQKGDYTLFNVKASGTLIDSNFPSFEINIGDTKKGVSAIYGIPEIDMLNENEHKFKFWITARNGAYWQYVWLRKCNGIWSHALQVKIDNKVAYVMENDEFPTPVADAFD